VSNEMWSYGDDGWKGVPNYWPDGIEDEAEALQQAGYSKSPDETWGYPRMARWTSSSTHRTANAGLWN